MAIPPQRPEREPLKDLHCPSDGSGIRERYDLQLTRYDDHGWRATFYTTGMEHSPTSATGTAWERTPWHATQRAAWAALKGGQRQS